MTKPDWKDAPEWAQWLAQDGNGDWYWYESAPFVISNSWMPQRDGNLQRAEDLIEDDWRESLEQRPAVQP